MAHCRICSDLDIYNLNLRYEDLREGVHNGCPACSMLLQGVGHFVSLDEISQLKLFVDYALYVEVTRRDKGDRVFIEFSTNQGAKSCTPLTLFWWFSALILNSFKQDCRLSGPALVLVEIYPRIPRVKLVFNLLNPGWKNVKLLTKHAIACQKILSYQRAFLMSAIPPLTFVFAWRKDRGRNMWHSAIVGALNRTML